MDSPKADRKSVTSDLVTNGIWHEHLLEADLVKLTNS